MLIAQMNFVREELRTRLKNYNPNDNHSAFTTLTLSTPSGGAIDLFGTQEQFKQLADEINQFLATTANDTAAQLTETTNAHAS